MTSTTRTENFSSTLYFRLCCFVLFFVAASASFSGFYQKWHFAEADVAGDDSWASIDQMLDGTAHRPSIYRQLLPASANWLDRVTPLTIKTSISIWQASDEDKFLNAMSSSAMANDPQYQFRYVVIYAETFLFALLAVYAMYWVCLALEISAASAMLAPVVLILLLPYIMANGGFFYDYPELAFFALAVLFALRRPWWWLLPIAVLGTLNKETFVFFLITLYPILRRNRSRRAAAVQSYALCAVALAVLIPVRLHFAHNPGGGPGALWMEHLRFFVHPRSFLFDTDETYGLRTLCAYTLLPLALIAWTAARGWKHLPRVMQQQAKLAAAINFPLYFFFCTPGEMRNLSLLYITLLLLIAANLTEFFRTRRGCDEPQNVPL